MNCADRDLDLLLLVHRQSNPVKQLTTQFHLWNCPRCQQRYQDFQKASGILIQGTGRTLLPPAMSQKASLIKFIPGHMIPIILLIAVILTALVVTVQPWLAPATGHPTIDRPCAPDLHNDRCQ